MLEWAETIAAWLLELPKGQKLGVMWISVIYVVPILVATSFAASMHKWMGPSDPVKWWRRISVKPYRQGLLASRRRAVTASLVLAAWSLPLLVAVAVEHAAWTAPEAIAVYERSVEAGQTFDDATQQEGEHDPATWASHGRVYPWAVLGFVLAMAVAFQVFLWLGYWRHAASVQASAVTTDRGGYVGPPSRVE